MDNIVRMVLENEWVESVRVQNVPVHKYTRTLLCCSISRECPRRCGAMTEAQLYSVYKGVYVPKAAYPPEALKYYEEFSFRKDDVLIVTYPRSGEWLSQAMFRGYGCIFFLSPQNKM